MNTEPRRTNNRDGDVWNSLLLWFRSLSVLHNSLMHLIRFFLDPKLQVRVQSHFKGLKFVKFLSFINPKYILIIQNLHLHSFCHKIKSKSVKNTARFQLSTLLNISKKKGNFNAKKISQNSSKKSHSYFPYNVNKINFSQKSSERGKFATRVPYCYELNQLNCYCKIASNNFPLPRIQFSFSVSISSVAVLLKYQ